MTLLLEFIGAILILVPFALLQAGRTTSRARSYLWLNLVGAVILTWVGWVEHQWGFVLVQFVWAVVAAWALSPWRRQPRPSAARTDQA